MTTGKIIIGSVVAFTVLLTIGVIVLIASGKTLGTRETDGSPSNMTAGRKAGVAMTVVGAVGLVGAMGAGLFTYVRSRPGKTNLRESPLLRSSPRHGMTLRSQYRQLKPSFPSGQPLSARGACHPHRYITKPDEVCTMPQLNLAAGGYTMGDPVRIGVVGDGSCMIHAIRRALDLNQLNRQEMIDYRTTELATQLSEADAPAVIDDKVGWAVEKKELLASTEWLDNELIPFFNRIYSVNIMELRYDDVDGYVVNVHPTSEPYAVGNPIIIIINIGVTHFETVGELPTGLSTPRTKFESLGNDAFVEIIRNAPYKAIIGAPMFPYTTQSKPIVIDRNDKRCRPNVHLDHTQVCQLASNYQFNGSTADIFRVGTKRIASAPITSIIHGAMLAHRLDIEPSDVSRFIKEQLRIDTATTDPIMYTDEWNGELEFIQPFLQRIADYFESDIVEFRNDKFQSIVNSTQRTNNAFVLFRSPRYRNHYEIVGHRSTQTYMNGKKDIVVTEIRKDAIPL